MSNVPISRRYATLREIMIFTPDMPTPSRIPFINSFRSDRWPKAVGIINVVTSIHSCCENLITTPFIVRTLTIECPAAMMNVEAKGSNSRICYAHSRLASIVTDKIRSNDVNPLSVPRFGTNSKGVEYIVTNSCHSILSILFLVRSNTSHV